MDKPTRLSGVDKKGWGYEMIWATNDLYCGKIMVFTREMAKTSMPVSYTHLTLPTNREV